MERFSKWHWFLLHTEATNTYVTDSLVLLLPGVDHLTELLVVQLLIPTGVKLGESNLNLVRS